MSWKRGDWSSAPNPYKVLRDEVTVVGRLVMRGMWIVVPLSLRERVLELDYEGHQGIVKTKDCLRSKVWWPTMDAMVERHCKKCLVSQAVTYATTMPTVKTTTMPTKPWRVHCQQERAYLSLLLIIADRLRWMLFKTKLTVASSSV